MITTINVFENENSLTIQIKGKESKLGNFLASFGTAYEDGDDLLIVLNNDEMQNFYSSIARDNTSAIKIKGLEPLPYEQPVQPSVPHSPPVEKPVEGPAPKPNTETMNKEFLLRHLNFPTFPFKTI